MARLSLGRLWSRSCLLLLGWRPAVLTPTDVRFIGGEHYTNRQSQLTGFEQQLSAANAQVTALQTQLDAARAARIGTKTHWIVFLSFQANGQKGFRRESRKRMNPLAQNFGFCWFARYLLTTFRVLGLDTIEMNQVAEPSVRRRDFDFGARIGFNTVEVDLLRRCRSKPSSAADW